MLFDLEKPIYLFVLLSIPCLFFLGRYYSLWKFRIREKLADTRLQIRLFPSLPVWKILPYFLGGAILCFGLALAGPVTGYQEKTTHQASRNILFLLDLSRSMNVQDANNQQPRIDEAKGLLTSVLPHLTNDRVGIVVFAGEARSILPLTSDYSAVETYLTALDTEAMKVQGTDLLAAMQRSVQSFARTDKNSRTLVLLSDGEDNEEHFEKALKLAKEEGIQVISVPLGSIEGGPIPEYFLGQMMGYKMDNMGQTVISKLADEQLRQLASDTSGKVIEPAEMSARSQALLQALRAQSSSGNQKVRTLTQEVWFQWPLGIGILFLALIYLFNPKKELNL